MARYEKLLEKLLAFPPTMRFAEVQRILEANGYTLDRIKGSHHMFVKKGAPRVDVPVHSERVKVEYLKDVAAKLELESS